MEVISGLWLPALIAIGFLMSLFYGLFAVRMFFTGDQLATLPKSQYLHQCWLNFAGAAAGWAALIFLVGRLTSVGLSAVAYIDIVIFVIALLGIVGFLPQMLLALVQAIGDLAKRIIEKALRF